jgi:hypothetical protein
MLVNVSPELPWSIRIGHVSDLSGTPGEGRAFVSLLDKQDEPIESADLKISNLVTP